MTVDFGNIVFKKSLLYSDEYAIIHQVNCFGRMGSGLAYTIAMQWPKVKRDYIRLCNEYKDNPRELLGTIQVIKITDRVIINAFSQYDYGRNPSKVYTDYQAVESCFDYTNEYLINHDIDYIGMPYNYGGGLGNGDVTKIRGIINSILREKAIYYDFG